MGTFEVRVGELPSFAAIGKGSEIDLFRWEAERRAEVWQDVHTTVYSF